MTGPPDDLKMVAVPAARAAPGGCLEALECLRAGADQDDPSGFWRRVSDMTSALLLARIDGLSPVEYLDHGQRDLVRSVARSLLSERADTFGELSARWDGALTA